MNGMNGMTIALVGMNLLGGICAFISGFSYYLQYGFGSALGWFLAGLLMIMHGIRISTE